MKRSKKAVTGTFGFWREGDSIHLAGNDPDIKNVHVTINKEPERVNGHPTLYRQLNALLERNE